MPNPIFNVPPFFWASRSEGRMKSPRPAKLRPIRIKRVPDNFLIAIRASCKSFRKMKRKNLLRRNLRGLGPNFSSPFL
jgi:hypothetical protein